MQKRVAIIVRNYFHLNNVTRIHFAYEWVEITPARFSHNRGATFIYFVGDNHSAQRVLVTMEEQHLFICFECVLLTTYTFSFCSSLLILSLFQFSWPMMQIAWPVVAFPSVRRVAALPWSRCRCGRCYNRSPPSLRLLLPPPPPQPPRPNGNVERKRKRKRKRKICYL